MAYQAFCVAVVGSYGSKIEVCENSEGFLYFREYFRSSYTGCMQAGKWQAVCSVEWNECEELIIDGYVLMQGTVERVSVSYRLPKGGIVKLPAFERVIGAPKVLRIDGKYSDNNGAYEMVFVRDAMGNVLSENNMYDSKTCYRLMNEEAILERFGIVMEEANNVAADENHFFEVDQNNVAFKVEDLTQYDESNHLVYCANESDALLAVKLYDKGCLSYSDMKDAKSGYNVTCLCPIEEVINDTQFSQIGEMNLPADYETLRQLIEDMGQENRQDRYILANHFPNTPNTPELKSTEACERAIMESNIRMREVCIEVAKCMIINNYKERVKL